MHSFIYYAPTKILFGPEMIDKIAEEIKVCQGSRVMVLHSASSVKSGLIGRIERLLKDADIPYILFDGIQPNPRLQRAREAVEAARRFQADFLLAVGGGSVIDTAKGVAHGLANPDSDMWDYFLRRAELKKSTPIGVVLTIAAAGSETSDSAVLTDEESKRKLGLNTPLNRPRFAVMNPELTYTLPPFQIGCGIVDIMMHTLDRYFTPTPGNDLSDAFAEALLRTVIENGRVAMKNPSDAHAMSELMWCGSVSHVGLTGLGAVVDFAPHALGRELSAMFDSAHGATLSAIWGSWALYCRHESPARFARLGREVWRLCEGTEEELSLAAIEKTVQFFREIAMPTDLSALGIGKLSDEVLHQLAHDCCDKGTRNVGTFSVLKEPDLYQIYRMANQ